VSVSQFRESILRYKSFLFYMDAEQGGAYREYVGASRQEELVGLSPEERAAKLSRELLIDYGNIGAMGQVLRRGYFPFWSWTEGNLKRYKRIVANVFREGSGYQKMLLALPPASRVLAGLAMFTGTGWLWNLLWTDDEEREGMNEYAKRRGWLAVPGSSDGHGGIRYVRAASTLTDLMEWLGLNEMPDVWQAVKHGQMDVGDVLTHVGQAPFNRLATGTGPFVQSGYEWLSGRRMFPNVFERRRIQPERQGVDWILARMWGLEGGWSLVRNVWDPQPKRPTADWILALLAAKKNDAGAQAYYAMMDAKQRFLERELGRRGSGGGYHTATSQVMRQYKTAIRYKDAGAARRLKAKLREMGVTAQSMRESLERMHPRAGIPKKHWKLYDAFLSPAQRQREKQAIRYYKETFR